MKLFTRTRITRLWLALFLACLSIGTVSAVSYAESHVVGDFADYDYWTSSENKDVNAWVQLFQNGYQFLDNKMDADRVRPVRSF